MREKVALLALFILGLTCTSWGQGREGVTINPTAVCRPSSHLHQDEDIRVRLGISITKVDACGFNWETSREVGRLEFAKDFTVAMVTKTAEALTAIPGNRDAVQKGRNGAVYFCEHCSEALVLQLRGV